MEKTGDETETITISKCAWWHLEAYREANEDTFDKAILRMSKNASKWEEYAVNAGIEEEFDATAFFYNGA